MPKPMNSRSSGEKLFRVTSQKHKTYQDVYAKDEEQALSRVADNDSGSAFRGKDVTVELNESGELAKKVVRGEIAGPGLKNKLSFWFNNMMYQKPKDAFLPSSTAIKELKKHGFSDDQIHMIRDTAAQAAYTAVNTLHKKYPEEVPKKYIAAMSSSFQVYNLFLNVGEEHHQEFMKLARQLFDSKIDKMGDKLKIEKSMKEDITPGTDALALLKLASSRLLSETQQSQVNEERRTADELSIGDPVEITGNVNHHGHTGEIVEFGEGKKFVVVNLYNYGKHSFHSSDVSEIEEEEEEEDTFYVVFIEEDDQKAWIGKVSKADSTKWRETSFKGEPDYRWGTSYMSYLTPDQVMSWIRKDYSRGFEEIEYFTDASEAIEYANSHSQGFK